MRSTPSIVNIELTNRCNKSCYVCGRRKNKKTYNQDMPFELLEKLAGELKNVLIQFHWDGEPTLYPRLGEALKLFEGNIRCFNTNGKLLVEKADEIIDNMETLTLSTFKGDLEVIQQAVDWFAFLDIKGDRKPSTIVRRLGFTNPPDNEKYGVICADRVLHKPGGSYGYTKNPTVPEHGICLDALLHPAIDVNGDMSLCVRFDPDKTGVIGNVHENTIEEIWNGEKRKHYLQWHVDGQREKHPLCAKCEFWGIPRS